MKVAHAIIYTHNKWRRDTYTKKLPGDNVSAQARYIPLKDLLPGLQDGYWFDNVDDCSQYLLQPWDAETINFLYDIQDIGVAQNERASVLLVQHSSGLWDLPCSIVQPQEAEPEVLSRELVRQARLSIACDYWNFVCSHHSIVGSQEQVHSIYAFERH